MIKESITKERTQFTSNDTVRIDPSLQQLEHAQVKRPSLSEKLLCQLLKIHTGKWLYTRDGSCHQLKVCGRCGNTKTRIKHQRKWRYINEITFAKPKIERTICPQCGTKFSGPFVLNWHLKQVHQINTEVARPIKTAVCAQQRVCQRCGEIWPNRRIRHVWGPAYSANWSTRAHKCTRCGEVEEWDTSNDD